MYLYYVLHFYFGCGVSNQKTRCGCAHPVVTRVYGKRSIQDTSVGEWWPESAICPEPWVINGCTNTCKQRINRSLHFIGILAVHSHRNLLILTRAIHCLDFIGHVNKTLHCRTLSCVNKSLFTLFYLQWFATCSFSGKRSLYSQSQ